MTENDENDENYILYHLASITQETQYDIARSNGFEGKKDKDALMEFFLGIGRSRFNDLTRELRYTSKSTNFLYVLKKSTEELISHFTHDYKGLDGYKKENLSTEMIKTNKFFVDDLYLLSQEKEYRFCLYRIIEDRVIPTIDDTYKRTIYNPVNKVDFIIIRLYLDKRILVVRYSKISYVRKVLDWLKTMDDFFTAAPIHFNKKNKEKALIGACVRTAKITFGDSESYKEYMKLSVDTDAQTDEVLNLQKVSKRFRDALEMENRVINYFSIAVKKDKSESDHIMSSDSTLTIRLNFEDSKLYFSSFLKEEEIKYWILNIIKKCDLDPETKTHKDSKPIVERDPDEFRD